MMTLIIVCITVCIIVALVFGFAIHRNDLTEVSTVVTLFPPKLIITIKKMAEKKREKKTA